MYVLYTSMWSEQLLPSRAWILGVLWCLVLGCWQQILQVLRDHFLQMLDQIGIWGVWRLDQRLGLFCRFPRAAPEEFCHFPTAHCTQTRWQMLFISPFSDFAVVDDHLDVCLEEAQGGPDQAVKT